MLHVITFEIFEDARPHRQVMSGIMHQVVDQITCNKSGKQRWKPVWSMQQNNDPQVKDPIKENSQGNTDHGRHHQSGFNLRLCVMYTMKEKDDPFSTLCFCGKVKNKAVKQVF